MCLGSFYENEVSRCNVLTCDCTKGVGFFACFKKEGLGCEEAQHGFAFLGAPVEIERDGDGADFSYGEKRFEMLGAAAARKADKVAFADALS